MNEELAKREVRWVQQNAEILLWEGVISEVL